MGQVRKSTAMGKKKHPPCLLNPRPAHLVEVLASGGGRVAATSFFKNWSCMRKEKEKTFEGPTRLGHDVREGEGATPGFKGTNGWVMESSVVPHRRGSGAIATKRFDAQTGADQPRPDPGANPYPNSQLNSLYRPVSEKRTFVFVVN